MPVRSHKAVLAGVDLMAGRSLGRMAKAYGRDLAELIRAIRSAKSPKGLKQRLSGALVRRMGTEAMTAGLADAATQAALIGTAAARPATESVERSKV